MGGFTDIHTHVLYGLDDGPKTRREMEQMLDAAAADSIARLYATPHVMPGLRPFDRERYDRHLAEARDYCQGQGYALELLPGAELLYSPAMEDSILRHCLPTLGEGDGVLLEFAPGVTGRELAGALKLLCRYGYRPILAHGERYRCLSRAGALKELKASLDLRVQVNGSSLLPAVGLRTGLRLRRWLNAGLVDFVASDAHNCSSRPFCMSKAYEALSLRCGDGFAGSLCGVREPEGV